VVGLLVVAVLLAIGWAWAESRSEHPLVDLRMMRLRAVWTTNLVAFLFGIAMYAVFAFLPQFLQTPRSAGYGFGASVATAGLLLLPMTVSMFAFGTASGWLSGRFGAKALLLAGSALSVPAFAMMAFAHDAVWQLLLAVSLFGAGFGLAFSAMANLIVDAVPSHQTGVASGMNANIRTVGGSVGAAVMASLVTAHAGPGGLPEESGYTVGFSMLLGAVVLAVLAGTLIPSLRVSRDAHQEEQASLAHGHLAIVAGGTVVGDDPE
jgi:MFS family permease